MAEVDNLNQSGIYQIINLINGKFYIGSAISFRRRWALHKRQLRDGTHENRHLLASWNFYGADSFQFRILELCSKGQLLSTEQKWLDWTKCYDIGYNINRDVWRSRLGVKSSPEHIEKLRRANTGLKRSPEACAKIGLAKKGTVLSEERKQARRDYRHTEEAKAKIAARRGWNHSEDSKAIMSEKAKIRIRKPFSDEHRKNLSLAAKAQWSSQKPYEVRS